MSLGACELKSNLYSLENESRDGTGAERFPSGAMSVAWSKESGWQLSFLKDTACKEFSTGPQGGFNYKDGKVQRKGFSGSPKVTYFELGWQEG